jgi:hypothetical protein
MRRFIVLLCRRVWPETIPATLDGILCDDCLYSQMTKNPEAAAGCDDGGGLPNRAGTRAARGRAYMEQIGWTAIRSIDMPRITAQKGATHQLVESSTRRAEQN